MVDLDDIKKYYNKLLIDTQRYVLSLDLYEQIAWGAVILGIILIASSLFFL